MSVKHKNVADNTMNEDKAIRKGSDPLAQTARGKLQNQRQKLNEKIIKELRMRAGAENLMRAAENNKKLRDRVKIELSYFNSNIQLLKEQLSEMNSSVEVYQHENCGKSTPMIPLGLKETSKLDFSTALKDVILEHYSDDGDRFNKEISDLSALREAVRTPERTNAGVELLMEYFNQLGHLEKRFFSTKRHIPTHFQWYDCLSGVPETQKSVGFEKGSIIFNIGALYTQIACKQDRTKKEGIVQAIVNFEKAAGSFRYLKDHFNAAPSQDMHPETLSMLISLMLAQAQECVLEGRLVGGSKDGVVNCIRIAQECAMVSQKYGETHVKMSDEPTKNYLPYTWLTMTETKHHFFKGLAYYYVALALLEDKESADVTKVNDLLENAHSEVMPQDDSHFLKVPDKEDDRKNLGRAYLRESVVSHEESLRVHDLCKHLRTIDSFKDILHKTHERALNKFTAFEEEDDFHELLTVPEITSRSEHSASPIVPDFSKVKVVDIFRKLGPISIFNATNNWSAPRTVVLERRITEGFGFSVKGDAPVIVSDVEENSVAMRSGMKVDDYIVGIGSVDTRWARHEEVVNLVRQADLTMKLTLISPAVKSEEPAPGSPTLSTSPPESSVQGHNATPDHDRKNKNRTSAPWMFMRRHSSKDKNEAPPRPTSMTSPSSNGNVKYASNGDIKTSHLANGGDLHL